MTGFGKSEGQTSLGKLYVEIRSVNHRYCDINLRLPKSLMVFENRIKETIRSFVSRGRIDAVFKFENTTGEKVQLFVDLFLADEYYKAFQILKEKFNLKDDINLQMFLASKDLITVKEETIDMEPYWEEIIPIVKRSIEEMDIMKKKEGEFLAKDIEKRLEEIGRELSIIKNQFPFRIEAYQNRLRERIKKLLDDLELDKYRFEQEVAILAERMDITEEIVRTESHLSQFLNLLEGGESVGRKMDFLIQEIYREINTISSKINDAEISQRVVKIKTELEKIREQVQNIE
jgi:uncharacterized protein (TIGR00255 family)